MMTDTPKNIADAFERLNKATSEYTSAKRADDGARSAATDALNELNAAQRDFDEAVKGVRHGAAPGSDWKSGRGIPV